MGKSNSHTLTGWKGYWLMKVIILAGGLGSRLSTLSEFIPKPMVKIGNKPIIHHIMETYAYFNHKDFYSALGYKSEKIKEYFINYQTLNSDFKIDYLSGTISSLNLSKILLMIKF